jgi:hypothetical protein
MNAPILKLFALVLVLFAALIGMTSYNSVINAKAYRENALNARPQIEQARVHRGVIRARDNTLLAHSIKGSDTLYRRRYTPGAALFAQVIGYDFLRIARAGLERSRNAALAGERNELTSIVDELRGKSRARATTSSRTSTRAPRSSPATSSPAARARSSRSSRRRARSASW